MKRILVIGAGLIGARHVRAVLDHPGCGLAGVVDPDPARREGHGAPGFADLDAVEVAVDGAIIASPTGMHLAHARDCAARGWDLLIEKPVAGTLAEADALVSATRGVATLVGHHRRYHASVAALKSVLDSGRIGRPVLASLIWAMKKPDEYFHSWRGGAGGSPVMINLVHDIDLLRFFLGEVTAVTGLGSSAIRGAGRVESGVAVLGFSGGATASIAFADTTPSPWGFEAGTGENPNIAASGQDMMWIAGISGAVSYPSLTVWEGAAHWGEAPVPSVAACEKTHALTAQLAHFVDVMDRAAAPMVSARDARGTLAVALQIEAALACREAAA